MSHSHTTSNTPVAYEMGVVRQFAIMTVIWGIVGMAVGVFIAAELVWPFLNFDTPWLTFSRLRPLHTNSVIFAFCCSSLAFLSVFYTITLSLIHLCLLFLFLCSAISHES